MSGARMTPFAGWDMPIQYTSVVDEHMAVREHCGMFDVSHMGDLLIRGAGARDLMVRLMTNDVASAPVGRCVYSHILDEQGRIIDDTIAMAIAEDEFLVVPNAATTGRVSDWIRKHMDGPELLDTSDSVATIAVQGPSAAAIMERMTSADLSGVRFFWGAFVMLDRVDWSGEPSGELLKGRTYLGNRDRGVPALLSRTGYTGEDGFEIACENSAAVAVWRALISLGAEHGLKPIGLGARDTLRLEKGLLLSGTDFDGSQTSLQTGPRWVVKLGHDFIGKDALERQKSAGGYPRLVGISMLGRGIPRHGYDIVSASNATIGLVTSGTMSPVLKNGVALGYVSHDQAEPGTGVRIRVRGDLVDAEVVQTPFVGGSGRK